MREKRSFLGVGAQVADLGNNFGLSVGFPYVLGLQYRLSDEPGWSPHIGLGLTGPHIGASYRKPPEGADVPLDKRAYDAGVKTAFFSLFGKKKAPPAAPQVDVNSPENIALWQKLEAQHLAGLGKTHETASDDDLRDAYLHTLNHPETAHMRGAPEFAHLMDSNHPMNIDQLNHVERAYLAGKGLTQATNDDYDASYQHAISHPSLAHLL